MGLVRTINRQLKISRLEKVIYRIARGLDLNIYAYVDFIFSDGTVISHYDWMFENEEEIRKYGTKGYILYMQYIQIKFPRCKPEFEFLNCVTQ